MTKQPERLTFDKYQSLMREKHNIEDRMAKIGNEKWRLNNENTQCGQKLKKVEDAIRELFGRPRIENKKEKYMIDKLLRIEED